MINSLLVFIFSLSLFAAESGLERKLKSRKQLSIKYKEGEHFLYDCTDNHFACVDQANTLECEDRRAHAKEARKELYPCIVIKKFENSEKCEEILQQKIEKNQRLPDCLISN